MYRQRPAGSRRPPVPTATHRSPAGCGRTGSAEAAPAGGLRKYLLTVPASVHVSVLATSADADVEGATGLLRVGDLIMVEVQISSPDRVDLPNVAIVDALPGGVEIENPRLATSAQAEGHSATPDHIEFLDDRAVLFTTVNSHQRTFRYQVRVTTPGRFDWPPIQASSMYDPAFASVHGGGQLVVYGRDEAVTGIAERPADAIDRQ